MTTETESSALIIQKIKKQKDEIIHQISEIKCPENLQQIEIWIKQIDLEPPTIHISLLAIAIDTIFFYFKNEINKESKRLIESSLCYLINKLSKQPNADEILEIVPILKAYIKTNDNEHKCKLEKITRKKIKPRIINFDENGKGYVVNEIRVIKKNSACGEKSIPKNKLYFPYENESQFTKDIREACFFINFLRKNKINYKYEKNIKNILQSYALEEFKAVICEKIYAFKLKNSNIFLLPNFSDIESKYSDNFLLLINFSILEKLTDKARMIANNINILITIFDDIKDLCSGWNVNSEFSKFYKLKNNFNAKFNNNTFVRYLEIVFSLFEENKLKLDKIRPNFHYEISELTLKNVSENTKMEINKLTFDLSVNRFIKKQQEAIQCYFDKHLQINLDNSQTNASFSVFKLFLIKICNFILNLFSINFFISNADNLKFFCIKYKLLDLELDCESHNRINKFTLKLNWLEFLKRGINPFFLASITFKKNLSEKLFLYIVNCKFLDTIKDNFSEESIPNNRLVFAKDLLLIRLSLENAKIGSIHDLICFYEEININLEKIGEPIIKLLNENKAFKEYLEAMDTLIHNTQSLNEEFSLLYEKTQENIVNLGKTQRNDRFSQYVSKGKCLFKLPQTTQAIPNSLIRHKI